MKHIGVIGCGWLGKPLLESFNSAAYRTFASYRNHPPSNDIPNFAWTGADPLSEPLKQMLIQCDAIVVTIPPQRGLSDDDNVLYHQQIAQKLSSLNEQMHVIYTSSTSVYGDQTGPCVEHSADQTTRAYRIEKAYHKYFENASILRFGGLIGPDRHPTQFFKTEQPLSQPKAWVNMTHQKDAIAAIEHLIRLESCGIFNVVSPEHVTRRDFYTAAFGSMDKKIPDLTDDESTGKRVLSDKIIQRLGFSFNYPNPLSMLKD